MLQVLMVVNVTSSNDGHWLMLQVLMMVTAAVEVVSKINPSNLSPTENIPDNNSLFSLKNSPVTISEILEATKLLQDKKTPDHNGISTNFL